MLDEFNLAPYRQDIMDIHKILGELYEDRERLNLAIAAMEGVAATGQRRRGRPPKWLADARKDKKKPPKKAK